MKTISSFVETSPPPPWVPETQECQHWPGEGVGWSVYKMVQLGRATTRVVLFGHGPTWEDEWTSLVQDARVLEPLCVSKDSPTVSNSHTSYESNHKIAGKCCQLMLPRGFSLAMLSGFGVGGGGVCCAYKSKSTIEVGLWCYYSDLLSGLTPSMSHPGWLWNPTY